MSSISAIGLIAQVLSLSGIVSIRMFLPVFLYFSLMRLATAFPKFSPEALLLMAEKVPQWQISYPFLGVFGVLAILEILANRDPEIKQFMVDELDRYTKPALSLLLACSVISTGQAEEVRELMQIQHAGIGTFGVFMGVVACGMTSTMCHLRAAILEKINAIDADDSFKLQTLSNWAGELFLVAVIVLLIFLPMVALALTLCGLIAGTVFGKMKEKMEKNHTHNCPACAQQGVDTLVSNCAFICPVCGVEQPEVFRVGWFGFSSSTLLGKQSRVVHSCRLLAAKRCRWCAEPLKSGSACPHCGRKQWDDEEIVKHYLRQVDIRSWVLWGIAVLTFFLPVAGCVVLLFLFRPLVLRPMTIHLTAASRFSVMFLNIFFKLIATIILLLLSLAPAVGMAFLLPFFIRYALVRSKFKKMIRNS